MLTKSGETFKFHFACIYFSKKTKATEGIKSSYFEYKAGADYDHSWFVSTKRTIENWKQSKFFYQKGSNSV